MPTTAQRDYRKCSPVLIIAASRDQLLLLKEGTATTSVLIPLLLFHPIVHAPQVNFFG
jgi:hypothetical protein